MISPSLSATHPLPAGGNALPAGLLGQIGSGAGPMAAAPSFSALLRDSVVAAAPATPRPPQPQAPQPDACCTGEEAAAKAQADPEQGKLDARRRQERAQEERRNQQARADRQRAEPAAAGRSAVPAEPPMAEAEISREPPGSAAAPGDAGPGQPAWPDASRPAALPQPANGAARASGAEAEPRGSARAAGASGGRALPQTLSLQQAVQPQQQASASQETGQPGGAIEIAGAAVSAPPRLAEGAAGGGFGARLEQMLAAAPEAAAAAAQQRPTEAGSGTEAAASTRMALAQPLHGGGFATEMAARVSLAALDGVQLAELHLNPAEMGPVQVQIVVEGQQAQISFVSEQADTRAVLERGLPELAAALREGGLTLSGGGVFQQAQQQRQRQQDEGRAQGPAGRAADAAGPGAIAAQHASQPPGQRPSANRGVLDLYV